MVNEDNIDAEMVKSNAQKPVNEMFTRMNADGSFHNTYQVRDPDTVDWDVFLSADSVVVESSAWGFVRNMPHPLFVLFDNLVSERRNMDQDFSDLQQKVSEMTHLNDEIARRQTRMRDTIAAMKALDGTKKRKE